MQIERVHEEEVVPVKLSKSGGFTTKTGVCVGKGGALIGGGRSMSGCVCV